MQTRLTDYFHVLDEVQHLLKKNQQLSDTISQSLHTELLGTSGTTIGTLLQKVLKNIEYNTGKIPTQRRHDTIIKKFATALYIFAGPMAYDFIHKNLPQALPSLRTVQINHCRVPVLTY